MNWPVLILIAVFLFFAMAAAFAVQRLTGASGWIDTIWSASVGAGGVAAAIFAEGAGERSVAVVAIIVIWSLRLGGHIGMRTKGSGEDPRYAALMEKWGEGASRRLFLFLQIQAVAAFVLVLVVHLASANSPQFPRFIDVVAIFLAIAALAGEAIADAQLSRFRRSPQARSGVCEHGLWRYSRHPNYFFEWLFWCSFPLLALNWQPVSWLSLAAPVMMYWLLVHASGIPPLEDHMLRSRGNAFRDLQTRVNAFFPGPRKTGGRP